MNKTKRQQAKRKERERKKTKAKGYAAEAKRKQRRRDRYPKIRFDTKNGDPEFVDAVRTALASIDFEDRTLFTKLDRRFHQQVRSNGFAAAMKTVFLAQQQVHEQSEQLQVPYHSLLPLKFGSVLLEQIPETVRRRLMPYNDVLARFEGRDLVLRFSSMWSMGGGNGTIYFSRRKPTVKLEGNERIVAFSRHAIERICERLKPDYIQYASAGDIHAFFNNCIYFEPVTLHGNQPAFALYDFCYDDSFASYQTYVKGVLGEENLDPSLGKAYYKVGYCPVAFEGNFAKAKTFLYPGYKGTPEYGLIRNADLSRSERNELFEATENLDGYQVLLNGKHDTIKWFHDNGVPQVVQFKHTVFCAI
jgi:hypothetical protein